MTTEDPETHTCPRRLESYGANQVGADVWESGHGLAGQDDVGVSCSYCGSLNPDRFMQLAGEGWWVDPTDKSYKAYLARPLSDGQVAELRNADWLAGPFVARLRKAVCEQDARRKAVDAVIEREWQQMPAARGHGADGGEGVLPASFDEAQGDEVRPPWSTTGTLRIGLPGYFYVLPFFMTRQDPAGEGT
jgi:hypothetical protein